MPFDTSLQGSTRDRQRFAPRPSNIVFSACTAAIVCCLGLASVARAQTLDTVTFGNATSESSHALATAFSAVTPASIVAAGPGVTPSNPSTSLPSQTVTGALGQSGRQLLPRTPNADVYGGQMTFTVKVDPVQQTYLTVKFWGSDANTNVWMVLDCNGLEVGSRHGGNTEGEIFWNFSTAWYPQRWIYRTLPLPLSQTYGHTTATITLRSLGVISYYNAGTYFGNYQELMKSPSPTLYEAASHVGSFFDSSQELQGVGPSVQTPLATPTAASAISTLETAVNNQAKSYLAAAPASLTPDDLDYLAETYGTTWSTYKGSASVVTQVVASIDALVTAYAAAPATYMGNFSNASWGGYFGPVGDAIRQLWPAINTGTTMSTTVAYGGSLGTVSRTAAWSAALRASIDSGRFNRQTITNQSIQGGMDIYLANRGLELVQSSNALNESEALRYVNEACGLSPWLGNDQAGSGPVPVYGTAPFGPKWYMMTSRGTSKEQGFVGSDYGEVGGDIYRIAVISGNAALLARALQLYQARDYFRYTGTDPNNYLIMQGAEPIGVRNDQEMPGHTAYLGRASSDEFLAASQGASVIGKNLLGYFQQGANEGQLWPEVASTGYASALMTESQQVLIPDYWTTVSTLAQTNVLLPETNGAGLPSFAWADEENAVVAAKYGSGATEENFYVNMFWHEPNYINGMAKVFDLTPTQARDVEVQVQDEQFQSSGITILGSNITDAVNPPWDNPAMATAGLPYLEAIRPDLTTLPAQNQDGGRGAGYTLRWGHWLVGMNAYPASTGKTYAMKMPSDFTSGTDLISGQNFSGAITLQPATTVVFYMATSVDPAPAPGRVLYLGANSGSGEVVLNWSAAAGASQYTVLRGTASGGPYTAIANGITQTQFADTTPTNGTTYFYVVASYNAAGVTGGNSPQASATPLASQSSGLPAPWANADIGATGATGSASYSNGTFTLIGSGADIWSNADAFQFVYAPLNVNGSITALVTSQKNTNANAKAGVMIRETLNAEDLNVDLVLVPSGSVQMNRRYGFNGGSETVASQAGITPPYWLRLAYTASNTFTGYISPDGINWTQLGTTGLGGWVPGTNYIGLVDTSHVTGTLATDVFSNVTLSGVPGDAVAAAPALTATAGVGQVSLSWTAASGATGYNLKRTLTSGGPYTTLAANTTTATYVDSAVTAGTTYFYVVSSLNATGEGANSAAVSATPLPPPNFSLTPGSTSAALTAGSTVQLPFTLLASGGFAQPVSFSCAVPAVAVTCTFASPTLTPSGTSNTTAVTVAWPAGVATLAPPPGRQSRQVVLWAFGLLLAGLGSLRKRRRTAAGWLAALLLLAPALLTVSGCTGATAPAAAAPVTHTLTITGTAGQIVQTTTVSLVVSQH